MAKRSNLERVRELIDDVDGVAFGKVGSLMDEMATACDRALAEQARMIDALEKTRTNLRGLSASDDDVFAAMVRRIDEALAWSDLLKAIEASKGGNTPGVTEDHRFEMMRKLEAIQAGR